MRTFDFMNEPAQVSPNTFEKYFRIFDRALIAFAVASTITLAAPAFILWFFITFRDLVAIYGWGHVPPASLPISINSADNIAEALSMFGLPAAFGMVVMGMLYARKCAEAVGISGYHWTSRWTIISLFIPFLCLVRPWLGFGEIRRSIVASHRNKTSGQAWRSEFFSLSTPLLVLIILSKFLVAAILSNETTIPYVLVAQIWLASDVVFIGYLGWYILSLRPLLNGLARSRYPAELLIRTTSAPSLSAFQEASCSDQLATAQLRPEAPQKSSKLPPSKGGSDDEVWQTFIDHEPSIVEAVERLSLLSPKNVEVFRTLFLERRDCSRIKEFEEEAVRRIQGPAFVTDATLREAYIELNHEDGRLGEELVRVVGVIGKPSDLERAIAQVRKKFSDKEIF